jgi:uncharacterized glyoxalase superfamily protein PhnB
MSARPKPTVWPILHYRDTQAARRFLVDVLGFEEAVAATNERNEIMHAEMRWPTGGGLVFGSTSHTDGVHGRMKAGSSAIYIATDDVDAVHRRTRAAGAEVVQPPTTTTFGSGAEAYVFTVRDPEGNLWTFGTYRGAE